MICRSFLLAPELIESLCLFLSHWTLCGGPTQGGPRATPTTVIEVTKGHDYWFDWFEMFDSRSLVMELGMGVVVL